MNTSMRIEMMKHGIAPVMHSGAGALFLSGGFVSQKMLGDRVSFKESVSQGIAVPNFKIGKFGRRSLERMKQIRPCASVGSKIPNADLLAVAERAAKAGADIVLDRVDKPRTISYKGAADLVTDTDQASEDAILSVIRESFPNHAILGEEGGVSGDTSSDYLWCVDPLDGTTNFAHGYPSFSVCVACLRHALPVAATVIEFAGGPGTWVTRTYTAARNKGAFMNGKPISVSREHDIQRSLLITGFGYEHDEAWRANIGLFQHFTDITQGVRRLGSAAIDMCHVASGKLFFLYVLLYTYIVHICFWTNRNPFLTYLL